jgi:hypothetical protein
MFTRCLTLIAALGLSTLAQAQEVPAGWKIVKDSKAACQMAVPSDWQQGIIPSMFHDAKEGVTITLVQETSYQVKPMSDLELKAHKAEKVVENSNQRVYLEEPLFTFGRSSTKPWDVWVAAPKGSCHATVSIKTGVDEATARKIVDTVKPAR